MFHIAEVLFILNNNYYIYVQKIERLFCLINFLVFYLQRQFNSKLIANYFKVKCSMSIFKIKICPFLFMFDEK
jgi:hypothetical protein